MIKQKTDGRKQADFVALYVRKEDVSSCLNSTISHTGGLSPHCLCPFFSRTNLPSFISNLPELAYFGSHNLSTSQCLRYLIITNQGHYVFAVHCASISVNMSTLWAIKHSKIIFTASFLPFKDNCLVFHVFLNSLFSVTLAWVCSYHHLQPWVAE